jgi:hypothetical protein
MDKFGKLTFQIHKVPHGIDLLNHFKDLDQIREFNLYPKADRNKVIRYIIYCYDFNSELIREYKGDIKKRREVAADLAGFERRTNGRWPDNIYEMMDLIVSEEREVIGTGKKQYVVPNIVDMVVAYLKYINNIAWNEIVALEHAYYDNFQNIAKNISGKTSKEELEAGQRRFALMEINSKIKIQLKNAQKEFYVDDVELQHAHSKIKRITPENVHDFDLNEYSQ